MYKTKGTARPQRPKPPKKAVARRGAPQEGGPLAVGQRVRVVRDGKVCDGDVSFLSPLRDTCTITYVDKTVETFVSVKRLRSASKDGGFAVLAAPPTAPAPKSHKSLVQFKRGDRVEVRRGKTWAKRTVRSCEATGPGTADLTLADPWGNEEFHQLDASEGLEDVIRWEKRPDKASLDTPPAPAPKAKAPQPKSPAPKAAAVKQLHDVVARQASAERERVETTGPAWARRGATCQVDCGHDWFDCTLTTREKQGTWRIRHADGAFENGVALERLRERQWFAAGSLARVAYQDRWHDCKILAVSRDRRTCTVRYEDNGYAEENVPVATRLRELRYADPVAPVPLPDFSKPAPKPVSLASSSDRDSPAVVESKKKKKTVPPPRFVERAPVAPKPKAKPLRAKPDIDLTGDDDESPRKAPKPKQKPAAPHPPSKPKPAPAKAAKAPPTVAAAKERAQPKPKPVPKAPSAPKAAKAKPEAPKAPKAAAATEKAAPKPKLVRKVTVEAAKEKAAPKPKPAPKAKADVPSKTPKATPAPKAKKPEVAAPPAPKPSPAKVAPAAPKAKAASKPQKKAETPKKAKVPAPKQPEKAEAPPKPDAEAAPRQPKRPSFFPKADAAPAPQPSPKKAAPTPPQEASPKKPAAASPKPAKPQTPPKPTPAGPQNTPAGPQTTPAVRPTPAAPATLTPNQSRSHEQALETLKLAANPDLEPLPPRRRPSAPKPAAPSPEKAAPPTPAAAAPSPKRPSPEKKATPVAEKEPEASAKPATAAPTPPSPEPATQKQQAAAPAPERPPTPPPPAKEATAASPKRERRLGPGTSLTPRRKSSIDEPVGRGALGRKVQKFETGPPPATPAPQPTSPSSTTPVLLHYKSGADVTSNEMDLTDKWLGKPVAALKAAFAKRMSLDVDGLSTKRADGTSISEALPIRDIIDGVEGSANVVFELKASE